MNILNHNNVNYTTVKVVLDGLSDVDATNKEAHTRLENLLASFAGKSSFTGGAIIIIDDSTINVTAEVRPYVFLGEAQTLLEKAFFSL